MSSEFETLKAQRNWLQRNAIAIIVIVGLMIVAVIFVPEIDRQPASVAASSVDSSKIITQKADAISTSTTAIRTDTFAIGSNAGAESTDTFSTRTSTEIGGTNAHSLSTNQWRAAAQDSLNQLSKLVDNLSQQGATAWATEEFNRIDSIIELGNIDYAQGRFSQANNHYLAALSMAQVLVAEVATVFSSQLEIGLEALQSNNATIAVEALTVARTIKPNDPVVNAALTYALKLPKLLGMETRALRLSSSAPESALLTYQAMLALAGDIELTLEPRLLIKAREAILRLQTEIRQRQLNADLTTAFNAIDEGRSESAIQGFTKILATAPSNSAAANGLAQANTMHRLQQQQQLWLRAQNAAEQENWQQVIAHYRALLLLNPSHANTLQALPSAEKMLEWNRQVQHYLQQPLLLTKPDIKRKALTLLQSITESLSLQPGESAKLEASLKRLGDTILWVDRALDVVINSDNETQVSVKQFGQLPIQLDAFEQRSIQLKPGEYQLIGRRQGYRDTRLNIIIDQIDAKLEYTISCDESLFDR